MKTFIAPFLSFLINGVGQIYNRQIKKGIFFILISFIFMILLVFSILLIFDVIFSLPKGPIETKQLKIAIILFAISVFILCLNGILSIIDAYLVAKRNK